MVPRTATQGAHGAANGRTWTTALGAKGRRQAQRLAFPDRSMLGFKGFRQFPLSLFLSMLGAAWSIRAGVEHMCIASRV